LNSKDFSVSRSNFVSKKFFAFSAKIQCSI
jgi:hypothetical protein